MDTWTIPLSSSRNPKAFTKRRPPPTCRTAFGDFFATPHRWCEIYVEGNEGHAGPTAVTPDFSLSLWVRVHCPDWILEFLAIPSYSL